MNRTIFLRELRVGLLQELVGAGIVLAIFATGARLAVSVVGLSFSEIGDVLSVSLIVAIGLMAFSSGARTFTAESRRRKELFLCILPISRTGLWLSMVGGRFAAAVLTAALLFLVGFSFLGNLPDLPESGPIVLVGLSHYIAAFAFGCCLSLLFRRDAAPYMAGLLIGPPTHIQLVALLSFQGPSRGPFLDVLLPSLFWLFSVGLFSSTLLLLSWFFFQKGEDQIRTRQLTNISLLGGTLVLFFLLLGAMTLSPILDGLTGPWTQDLEPQTPAFNWSTSPAPVVSASGRYLAVVETLRRRVGISRVTIVETATGHRIGAYRWRGVGWVSWDARNEVLRILCRDCAIPFFWRFPIFQNSEWIWLTPEGRELAHHSLEPINEALSLRDGSDLLVDGSSRARLIRPRGLNDLSVLAEIPQASRLHLWGGQCALLTQRTSSTTEVVRQVKDGTVHAAVGLDRFLEPYLSFLLEIEAKSGQKLLKTSGKDRLIEKPIFGGISLPDKLALYLPIGSGSGALNLYDGSLDREILLPPCPGGPATTPELIPTRNSPAFLIRYQCRHIGASGQALQLRHFYYFPGSGSLKALPALDQVLDGKPILLAWLDEQTTIWRPEKGETWKILQNGQIRTLWPARSGE